MDNSKRKPIIGILGGIGSGKTSVANEFAKLGCAIIDADKIAHQLLDEPSVKKNVVESFGDSILDAFGKIDHKKLAGIVFADADKLSVLNHMIHPTVIDRCQGLVTQFNSRENIKAIVLDIPLLIEVGLEKQCDRLIFVDCQRQLRVKRAKKTGIFDENQLKIRENFQISLDTKAAIADNTINNNSGLSELAGQVANIFSTIMNNG